MSKDFARLDELLAKSDDRTEAEDDEFARLMPVLLSPGYKLHVLERIEAVPPEIVEGIKGEFDGPEPKDESEYFEVCPQCGQAFDARDLAEVAHHVTLGHKPRPTDA